MARGVTWIKKNSNWVAPTKIWTKQDGTWTEVQEAYIKNNGQWELVFPPPIGVATLSPEHISFSVYTSEVISKTVTLTNTGNDALNIVSYNISQASSFSTELVNANFPVIVNPGSQITLTFQFRGTSVNTTGSVITFNTESQYIGNSSFNISATGTVLARYSRISTSPSSVSFVRYEGDNRDSKSVTLLNNGNGTLSIYGIATSNNKVEIVTYPSTISAGGSGTLVIRPVHTSLGTDTDTIRIDSNADNGYTTIPISIETLAAHGSQNYTSPGNYSFKVPNGVYRIDITAVGGGGGGGGSTEVGNGGGGGGGAAGGYTAVSKSVTPGEYLTIVVGAGGDGSPYVGRDRGASGGGGTAKGGTTSQISGSFGSVIAAGGPGGNSGTSGGGGAGGQGGGGSGGNGQSGTRDNSSTAGGAGGSNGSGYGSGGAGASAPDRVSPYNWAGNPGSAGAILLSW